MSTEWEDLKFIFAILMLPVILVAYLLIELVNAIFVQSLVFRFIFYLVIFGTIVFVIVETDILKNASRKIDHYLS